jgi:hypothetical protein
VNIALFELSKRSKKGQGQAEFAAAFTVLIVIIIIPLVNLAAVPMRTGLAQAVIKDTVKTLCRSEKFSDAVKAVQSGSLQQRLAGLGGVEAKTVEVALRLSKAGDSADRSILVNKPGAVPSTWLPEGQSVPNVQLVLTVQTDVSPMLLGSSFPGKIPGLTVPFSLRLEESSTWENLGRDPNTGEFYLNE